MTMETHSRSYLLVQQELVLLQEDVMDIQIVDVELPTRILVLVFPPSNDENWKDSRFYMNILFPENFPFIAPSFRFLTIPFHPNVDPTTGECCLPMLLTWNSRFRVVDVIKNLLNVLAHPILTKECHILNYEARDLFVSSSTLYTAMARQCARNSQNLGDLMAAKDFVGKYDLRYSKERPKAVVKSGYPTLKSEPMHADLKDILRQVAFDDYQKTWSQMGTTKYSGKLHKEKLDARPITLPAISNKPIIVPRAISTDESEPSRMRTALKMKLDTFMSPEPNNSFADIESVSGRNQGRAPPSMPDFPASVHPPIVSTNTPIREESPFPSTQIKTTIFVPTNRDSAVFEHQFSHANQNGQPPSIGVTMVQKVNNAKESKDFVSQMPSLPPSQENKFRFRSDEPIFDKNPDDVQEMDTDALLEWSHTLQDSPADIA